VDWPGEIDCIEVWNRVNIKTSASILPGYFLERQQPVKGKPLRGDCNVEQETAAIASRIKSSTKRANYSIKLCPGCYGL
jgi:hypothetical protein